MKPSQTMNGKVLRLCHDEAEHDRWSESGIVCDGLATEVGNACDKFFKKKKMTTIFKMGFNYYAKKKE